MKKCRMVGGRVELVRRRRVVWTGYGSPSPSFTHTLGFGFCEATSVRSSMCGRVRVKVGAGMQLCGVVFVLNDGNEDQPFIALIYVFMLRAPPYTVC